MDIAQICRLTMAIPMITPCDGHLLPSLRGLLFNIGRTLDIAAANRNTECTEDVSVGMPSWDWELGPGFARPHWSCQKTIPWNEPRSRSCSILGCNDINDVPLVLRLILPQNKVFLARKLWQHGFVWDREGARKLPHSLHTSSTMHDTASVFWVAVHKLACSECMRV